MKKPDIPRDHMVDIARMAGALLIVALHIDLFSDVNSKLNAIFAHYLPRIAVPFFLCVSGYYYMGELFAKKYPSKKSFFRYLKTYSIWTLIYYVAAFFYLVPTGKRPLGRFLLERVVYFFTVGGYTHLWYMVALIYAMCLATIIYTFCGKKGIYIFANLCFLLYAIGCFGSAYYSLGFKIPFLSSIYRVDSFESISRILLLGIPMYISGAFIHIVKFQKKKTNNILLSLTILILAIDICFLAFSGGEKMKSEMFLSLYPVTIILINQLLAIQGKHMKALSIICRKFSGFLYFVHPLVIECFRQAVTPITGIIPTPILMILVLMSSAWLWLLCEVIKKKHKKFVDISS